MVPALVLAAALAAAASFSPAAFLVAGQTANEPVGTWAQLTPASGGAVWPEARQVAAFWSETPTTLLLAGGFDLTQTSREDILRYDISSGLWTLLALNLSGVGMGQYGLQSPGSATTSYLIGGREGNNFLSTVRRVVTNGNMRPTVTEVAGASITTGRSVMSCAADIARNDVLCFGGMTDVMGAVSQELTHLDLSGASPVTTDLTAAQVNAPVGRSFGMAAMNHAGDTFIVYGGATQTTILGDVAYYNVATQTWTAGAGNFHRRQGFLMLEVDTGMLLGGYGRIQSVGLAYTDGAMFRLCPDAAFTSRVDVTPSGDVPVGSLHATVTWSDSDTLWVFGGQNSSGLASSKFYRLDATRSTGNCGSVQPPGTTGTTGMCMPLTVCPTNACGTISDGCMGTLQCGGCAFNNSICQNNVCQCAPSTCASLGRTCNPQALDDNCGGTIAPDSCGACVIQTHSCVNGNCQPTACVPLTSCAAEARECGTLVVGQPPCDPVTCGSCNGNSTCNQANGRCECDVTAACAAAGSNCGTIDVGCGQQSCGTCPGASTCAAVGNTGAFRCTGSQTTGAVPAVPPDPVSAAASFGVPLLATVVALVALLATAL